ncbi:unnamed protein product [Sphagnum tenellum]
MRGVITEDGTPHQENDFSHLLKTPTVPGAYRTPFSRTRVRGWDCELAASRGFKTSVLGRDDTLFVPGNESSVETLRPAASRIISICVSVFVLEESSDRRE